MRGVGTPIERSVRAIDSDDKQSATPKYSLDDARPPQVPPQSENTSESTVCKCLTAPALDIRALARSVDLSLHFMPEDVRPFMLTPEFFSVHQHRAGAQDAIIEMMRRVSGAASLPQPDKIRLAEQFAPPSVASSELRGAALIGILRSDAAPAEKLALVHGACSNVAGLLSALRQSGPNQLKAAAEIEQALADLARPAAADDLKGLALVDPRRAQRLSRDLVSTCLSGKPRKEALAGIYSHFGRASGLRTDEFAVFVQCLEEEAQAQLSCAAPDASGRDLLQECLRASRDQLAKRREGARGVSTRMVAPRVGLAESEQALKFKLAVAFANPDAHDYASAQATVARASSNADSWYFTPRLLALMRGVDAIPKRTEAAWRAALDLSSPGALDVLALCDVLTRHSGPIPLSRPLPGHVCGVVLDAQASHCTLKIFTGTGHVHDLHVDANPGEDRAALIRRVLDGLYAKEFDGLPADAVPHAVAHRLGSAQFNSTEWPETTQNMGNCYLWSPLWAMAHACPVEHRAKFIESVATSAVRGLREAGDSRFASSAGSTKDKVDDARRGLILRAEINKAMLMRRLAPSE